MYFFLVTNCQLKLNSRKIQKNKRDFVFLLYFCIDNRSRINLISNILTSLSVIERLTVYLSFDEEFILIHRCLVFCWVAVLLMNTSYLFHSYLYLPVLHNMSLKLFFTYSFNTSSNNYLYMYSKKLY